MKLAIFFLALCLLIVSPSAFAQEHQHAQAEADDVPLTFPAELLERPVTIRAGTGAQTINDPVTTSSKEAQAFYTQGVAYLHGYVFIEAARSFNQALRLDPKLAMAYVGLSRAYAGLNVWEAARAAVDQAQALAPGASKREQLRIALRAKQLTAIADRGNMVKFSEYKKALDEALAAYPQDTELWLLRGNAEEDSAAGRGQRGGEASIQFYEKALQLVPDNIAAHHYLTHSCENVGRIPEALQHGEVYARLAFSVPHALHMYGHDLRRVGRVADAITQFRRADQLELDYYKAENIPPQFDWHHEHNLDLLATSYQHQGQMKEAERIMRQAFTIPSMQDTLEFNKKQWPQFLIARGRMQEALEAAARLSRSRSDIVRAIGFIFVSHAEMALNDLPAASAAAKSALREMQQMGSRATLVTPYMEALQGEFFLRTGEAEKGRGMLKQVVSKIRSERGPDAWVQALFRLEAIGAAARRAGDWELAETMARQMLDHDPAYAGSHYALALAAEHKNDNAVAIKEYAEAEKLWRNADADLPELQQARARLAVLRK
ncbi:MAG TPA: tetratricopeptide repeat protein [Blastocatellia bacterium]|nr:tetratricopeptide repeat protein [Blastocatellia bacterium]